MTGTSSAPGGAGQPFGIPPHNCDVFQIYNENDHLSVRCEVCDKQVLWCDIKTVGGGVAFWFYDAQKPQTAVDRRAMYLSSDVKQKLR
jgi:hypothetical protein